METLAAASSAVGQYEAYWGINLAKICCTLVQPVWMDGKKMTMVSKHGKRQVLSL
jgi:hypothetical protein